eukprot:Colp12_sorted_trinity150504_noHs@7363
MKRKVLGLLILFGATLSLSLPLESTLGLGDDGLTNSTHSAGLLTRVKRASSVSWVSASTHYLVLVTGVCSGFMYLNAAGTDTWVYGTNTTGYCEFYQGEYCSDSTRVTSRTAVGVTGNDLRFVLLICDKDEQLQVTATGTYSSDSYPIRVTSLEAPVDKNVPLILYEGVCSPPIVINSTNRYIPSTVQVPLQFLWSPDKSVQRSCQIYSDASCTTVLPSSKFNDATRMPDGSGTYTYYVMCTDSSFVRPSQVNVVGSTTTYLMPNSMVTQLSPTLLLAVQSLSWATGLSEVVTGECSGPFLLSIRPAPMFAYKIRVRSTNAQCSVYSDVRCNTPLANDMLPIVDGATAAYVRCQATSGSVSLTAFVNMGLKASAAVPISSTKSCGFTFLTASLVDLALGPNSLNNITATVLPSTAIPAGGTLSFCGFGASGTPATTSLAISGADAGVFGSIGNWNTLKPGCVVLKVASGKSVTTTQNTVVMFRLLTPSTYTPTLTFMETSAAPNRVFPAGADVNSGIGGPVFSVKKAVMDTVRGLVVAAEVQFTIRPVRPLQGINTIS